MKRLITTLLFLCMFVISFTQETASSDTLRKDALKVYMNASSYIKTEIPFINYVRDRKLADLVIIETWQQTGSGGSEYLWYLEGQNSFSGMRDTISCHAYPDEQYEVTRKNKVQALKIGLMRYVQKTPLAKYLRVNFSLPIKEEISTDKWRNWVFRTSINGSLNGRESYKYNSLRTSFSASKVTSEWKFSFSASYRNSLSQYDYGAVKTSYRNESSSISLFAVKSLGNHLSVGGRSSMYSSIYSNVDLRVSVNPGIEYDFFPYSESTRRLLTFQYNIGFNYNDYVDTTQFFKTKEYLGEHSFRALYTTIQKWGTMEFSASWSNYLHDWNLSNFSLYGYLSLKIAKGLSLNLTASYSFIHDQISLRKGDATVEDILLHRKEVATSFSYFTSVGLSYTFGSIYNNVVNPRFSGSGMIYYMY